VLGKLSLNHLTQETSFSVFLQRYLNIKCLMVSQGQCLKIGSHGLFCSNG